MTRSDSSEDSSSASSKKVAKAAKAGATPSSSVGKEQRSLGFPMAMAAVVVIGVALVAFSWSARDVQALSPSFTDHWHLPYGVYDCQEDGFLDPFADNGNPGSGIHTHMDASGVVGDGVVHLHPRSSISTGGGAQLERMFESVTAGLDGESITFPDRPALSSEGVMCDGEPAVLQVVRFASRIHSSSDEPVDVLIGDIGSYRFREDFEPFVIALAPEGADIPLPPQSALDGASAASPFIQSTAGLDGLQDLDLGDDVEVPSFGFNEDGVLVDPATGEPILDPEGNEITNEAVEVDPDAEDSDDDAEE